MRSGVAVAVAVTWGSGLALLGTLGCSSSTVEPDEPAQQLPSGLLELEVGPDALTFVELATPSQLELDGDGKTSIAWDLAFQGREVFSNGGVSGPGDASVFGPLSAPAFLSNSVPQAPLMQQDRSGSAFLGWYDYYGDEHTLFSRYHVYGLRDGERLFKLQVLGYYADKLGAPLPGYYTIRYAEVFSDGSSGESQEITKIDATAGGTTPSASEPSACVELDSARVSMLTPEQAADSDAWHLCFRRETIAVNGGVSGIRGVESVDLQGDETIDETEDQVQARTAESELALFESIDHDALSAATVTWKEDGVATVFAQRWLEPGTDPLELSASTWYVVAADKVGKYLLKFETLSGDPAVEAVTLGLRVKPVMD